MTLIVHTARIGYARADALDVTRKSAGPDGIVFAPSWQILRPALDDMARGREVEQLARNPADDLLGRWMQSRAWGVYWRAYLAEMVASHREHRAAWDRLLARERVTLLCYCTDPAHCHRMILGAEILPALGAVYGGERDHEADGTPSLPGVRR